MENVSAPSLNATGQVLSSLTQVELWIQLVLFYLVINGLGAAFINCVVFYVVVVERKQLSTRFYVIIASLALIRGSAGIQIIITGCYRILRTLHLAPTTMNRVACHFIHFVLYFQGTLELALLIILVIDRVLAIAAIERYRHLTVKQALHMCSGISVAIVVFKIILSYTADFNIDNPLACTNMYSASGPHFNLYTQNIDFTLVLLLLSIYFWLIIDLKRRARMATTSEELKAALKRRSRVMPAIRNLVLLHCGFTLTAKLIGVVSTAPAFISQADRIIAYQGMVICCDNLASGIALVMGNKDLRIMIKKRVFGSTVAPAGDSRQTVVVSHCQRRPDIVYPV